MKFFKNRPAAELINTAFQGQISQKPKLDRLTLVDTVGRERKPDFLCVGSEKAGTTWLWHWMNKHPDVGVPASKELRFFSNNTWDPAHFRALTRLLENPLEAPSGPRFKTALTEQLRLYYGGEAAYLRIFGNMEQSVVGEVSPQYCMLPTKQIAHIKSLLPDAKIIYMLRDPVERLLSGARMAIRRNKTELSEKNILRFTENAVQRKLSDSSSHIESYERFFGSENVKVVIFDEVKNSPLQAFYEVCEFLSVQKPQFDPSEISQKVNKGANHDVSFETRQALRKTLAPVYDKLSDRFPELVSKWDAERPN